MIDCLRRENVSKLAWCNASLYGTNGKIIRMARFCSCSSSADKYVGSALWNIPLRKRVMAVRCWLFSVQSRCNLVLQCFQLVNKTWKWFFQHVSDFWRCWRALFPTQMHSYLEICLTSAYEGWGKHYINLPPTAFSTFDKQQCKRISIDTAAGRRA